ncbi:hypothetical protein FACS1894126_4180 [Alphaproteobacteria bacterium]|nr:hypothetical protein FACS1894126_4180 [Alphaproteobacteria bacterium]
MLAICDGIDADEETQNVEKREQELQKHEEEIKKREREIEKQKDGYQFISVEGDGIHINNAKTISKDADLQFFVFKMLLKNKIDAALDRKKVGLKWHQIADELEKREENEQKTFSEDQIKQIIRRIRKSIVEKHGEIVCNEVIKCTSSGGYLLGEKTTLILRGFL